MLETKYRFVGRPSGLRLIDSTIQKYACAANTMYSYKATTIHSKTLEPIFSMFMYSNPVSFHGSGSDWRVLT